MKLGNIETLGDLENVRIEEFVFLVFAILIGMLILAGVFYAYAVNKRKADDAACTIRQEYAKVVDRVVLQQNMAPQWSSVQVVFELMSGERVSFAVMATENYVVGDQGMLKWQGKSIRSFTRGVKPSSVTGQRETATPGSDPASSASAYWRCTKCDASNPKWTSSCLNCNNHR